MKLKVEEKAVEIEENSNGFALFKALGKEGKPVAMKVNGELKDLSIILKDTDEVSFVFPDSEEGFDLINHSCAHLMAQALMHLYPGCLFGFGPSIEEGFYYDVDFLGKVVNEEDFPAIEEEMAKLVKEAIPFKREDVSKQKAKEIFKDNHYKLERIDDFGDDEIISVYHQGDFVDLCHGPHVPNTSYLKNFKLLSVAGAYWKGDPSKGQLTRIYATCQPSKEALEEHLRILELRKENDHRKLGRELSLFMINENAPGMPFFLPKGTKIKNALLDYWRQEHIKAGYLEISTPQIMSRSLWEKSGHWDHYKENMFTTRVDDIDYAIKPMNCPGAMLTYNHELHSYRELPLRYAELGHVHRYEASGALNGLFRVRAFTQDDAHIFVRFDQIEDEVRRIMALFDKFYEVFGLTYKIVLSTRPSDNYIGSEEYWTKSEEILSRACLDSGKEFSINEGDGAFYGPKLDFKLKDTMGRSWQCGTIQLDVNLPARFGCFYIDEKGEKVQPVILHRVVLGSIERFIGILIEHYGGAFPTWLAPTQVKIVPVNKEAHLEYSTKVASILREKGIRVDIDESDEKLSYKIRSAQVNKIPFTAVVGDKEASSNSINCRIYGQKEQSSLSLEEFINKVLKSIEDKARY